jgi:hypothetical protein
LCNLMSFMSIEVFGVTVLLSGITFFFASTPNVNAHGLRVDPDAASFSLDGGQGDQTFSNSVRVKGTIEDFRTLGLVTPTYFEVDVFISNSFSSEQQEIVQKATRIMAERVLSKRVMDCTYRSATRNYQLGGYRFPTWTPSSDQLRLVTMLNVAFRDSYEGPNRVGQLYIGAFNGGYTPGQGFAAGRAYQNYMTNGTQVPTINAPESYDYDFLEANSNNRRFFYSAYEQWQKNHPAKQHTSIELNSSAIGSTLPLNMSTADRLAGTIAHEILHNIGWDHTNNKPESYPGTVIKEFGLCLARDGSDARVSSASFGLTSDPATELENLIISE